MTFKAHWLSMARLREVCPASFANRGALRREAARACVPEQPLGLAQARIEGKIFGVLVTPL